MIFSPKNIEELKELLSSKDSNTYFIAGGTDLIIKIKNKKITDYKIIDLTKVVEFKNIVEDESTVSIGSLVTMTELTQNKIIREQFNSIYKAAYHLGSEQIRNLATIGGNLANASQSADVLLSLYSLEADIKVLSASGDMRIIPIRELIVGKEKTSLQHDEVIAEIILKKDAQRITGFCKIGSRKAVTISKVSCAANLILEDNKISSAIVYLGAVGTTPTKAKLIEDYLTGKALNEIESSVLKDLGSEEIDLAIPTRSSRNYKRMAAKGLMEDLLQDLNYEL